MQYKTATAAGILAAYSLLQSCPAPVVALIPIIAEIAGAIAGAGVYWFGRKRDFGSEGFTFEAEFVTDSQLEGRASCMPTPNGVPENVIQNCCNALNGAYITVKGYQSSKSKCAG